MKKIIIADALKHLLEKENSFMRRPDVKLFTAVTNDDVLAIHQAEKANLIISQLDMRGMGAVQLFTSIRNDLDLRTVSLILLCSSRAADRARADQCCPNAVLTLPVSGALLMEKAQGLLNIPWRESYRVLLSVNIEGNGRGAPFFCRSENISASGLLLETDRSLEEGDRLTCSFFLPDSERITATGEIARKIVRPDKPGTKQYGVKFDKLAPGARFAIETFVAKKVQKSHPKPD